MGTSAMKCSHVRTQETRLLPVPQWCSTSKRSMVRVHYRPPDVSDWNTSTYEPSEMSDGAALSLKKCGSIPLSARKEQHHARRHISTNPAISNPQTYRSRRRSAQWPGFLPGAVRHREEQGRISARHRRVAGQQPRAAQGERGRGEHHGQRGHRAVSASRQRVLPQRGAGDFRVRHHQAGEGIPKPEAPSPQRNGGASTGIWWGKLPLSLHAGQPAAKTERKAGRKLYFYLLHFRIADQT